MMDPVELHGGLSDHESEIALCVDLSEAVVRAGSEDEEVLSSFLLGVTGVVALGVVFIGVVVDFWIAESWVDGWDDHCA